MPGLLRKHLVLASMAVSAGQDLSQCLEGWHCVRPSQLTYSPEEIPSDPPRAHPFCPTFQEESTHATVQIGGNDVTAHCDVQGLCRRNSYFSDAAHFAAAPVTPGKRRLLHVFLPGTDAFPEEYTGWLKASQAAGFHTIGLSYASSPFSDAAASYFCKCSSDTPVDCLSSYHDSALFGGNATPWQSSSSDSITARVVALLSHLDRTFPDEGWKSFRWDDEVAWAASVWSGHAQGGSHVAYLLKVRELFRAVLLSAPQDESFMAGAGENNSMVETPWHNVYGFVHFAEDSSHIIQQNWQRMATHAAHASMDPEGIHPPALGSGSVFVVKDPQMASPDHHLFGINGQPETTCKCSSYVVENRQQSGRSDYHCSTAKDGCAPRSYTSRDAFWQRLIPTTVFVSRQPTKEPSSQNAEAPGHILVVVSVISSFFGLVLVGYCLNKFCFKRSFAQLNEDSPYKDGNAAFDHHQPQEGGLRAAGNVYGKGEPSI